MSNKGDGRHNGENRPPIESIFRQGEEAAGDQLDSFARLLILVVDRNGFDGAGWILWLFGALPNINENNENHENDEIHANNNENNNENNQDNADDPDNDNVNDVVDFDNHNVDNDDDNNENAADVDAVANAEVAVGVGLDVEEWDLLPRRSIKRPREEDEEDDEERSRKRFRWCDEDDWSSGTGSICSDHNYTDKNTRNTAVKHAGASAEFAEEDPLPGPSTKRPRQHDGDENKSSSSNKLRQCLEFAASDSDTDTDTTGHNLAQSSCDIDLTEDEGAAEDTDKEDSQQVGEEDQQHGCSGKRTRKRDDIEKGRGSKKWRR